MIYSEIEIIMLEIEAWNWIIGFRIILIKMLLML